MYKLFSGGMFSFLLGTYLEMEFLGHRVTLFNLLRNFQTVYQTAVSFYIPPAMHEGSISSRPGRHLLLSVLLIGSHLCSMKWNHTVVLICASLITNDVKRFFFCFLVICVSYLEKCVFRSFAYILIRLFVFWY